MSIEVNRGNIIETLLEEELEKESNGKIEIDKLPVEVDFILSYILELDMPIEVDKNNIIEILSEEGLEKESNREMKVNELPAGIIWYIRSSRSRLQDYSNSITYQIYNIICFL